MTSRLRTVLGLGALAELLVFIAVAAWIGLGWAILASLATSALGWVLLAKQGTKTLTELRLRAQEHRAPGTALGDAGLVAAGGFLMILPGFVGDVLGLLCLLPGTRRLPRALIARAVLNRLPDRARGPVRVQSTRPAQVDPDPDVQHVTSTRVVEGTVVDQP
ncbi:FxsA family protein [Klenkia sp. PcliD-1-E]|uniref:FxsA family protein n=1 Tax=Klenkia sp. PcliD-1-E TaxID=2954492 RepID=UPI002097BF90|nr:FxsA family protein [Klenkia sp. PcliD-1-E]MCO7218945.1 FxsA family protein [Klenkia sp. PcliD-1-E]